MANSGKLISIWSYADSSWKTFGENWNNNSYNNEIVRAPSDYNGISSTVVDNARNADGVVVGNVIREDLAKIEVVWKFLTLQEFASLSQLFNEKYGGKFFVPVAFFDETLGDYDGDNLDTTPPDATNNPVRIFYPNDRSAKFAQMKIINGKPVGYENVSLHLIDTGKRYGE